MDSAIFLINAESFSFSMHPEMLISLCPQDGSFTSIRLNLFSRSKICLKINTRFLHPSICPHSFITGITAKMARMMTATISNDLPLFFISHHLSWNIWRIPEASQRGPYLFSPNKNGGLRNEAQTAVRFHQIFFEKQLYSRNTASPTSYPRSGANNKYKVPLISAGSKGK